MNMEDYKVQSTKLEIKTCEEHKDQPYSLGCKACLTIICTRCVPELDNCSNGKGGFIESSSLAVTALDVIGLCINNVQWLPSTLCHEVLENNRSPLGLSPQKGSFSQPICHI